MDADAAFDRFDKIITPDWLQRSTAEARLDRFVSVLTALHSGITVIPSGSWARGTAIGPIHDVDLILVLPYPLRSVYDRGSRSAEAVLEYTAALIAQGVGDPSPLGYMHTATLRNHVVKCYLDSKIATDDRSMRGFAVEVMPAFRDPDGLRVPERLHDRWSTVDPEKLIEASRRRQQGWPKYTAMVRLLKAWAREHAELKISPLAMEVLALRCLPHPPLLRTLSRTEALKAFFTAAAAEIMNGVPDPAGHSGDIAPELRRGKAREVFRAMADLAATADAWSTADHPDHEDITVYFLRKIFGREFPEPSGDWKHLDGLRPWQLGEQQRRRWREFPDERYREVPRTPETVRSAAVPPEARGPAPPGSGPEGVPRRPGPRGRPRQPRPQGWPRPPGPQSSPTPPGPQSSPTPPGPQSWPRPPGPQGWPWQPAPQDEPTQPRPQGWPRPPGEPMRPGSRPRPAPDSTVWPGESPRAAERTELAPGAPPRRPPERAPAESGNAPEISGHGGVGGGVSGAGGGHIGGRSTGGAGGAARTSRFHNPGGHHAVLGAATAPAPVTVRGDDPAG